MEAHITFLGSLAANFLNPLTNLVRLWANGNRWKQGSENLTNDFWCNSDDNDNQDIIALNFITIWLKIYNFSYTLTNMDEIKTKKWFGNWKTEFPVKYNGLTWLHISEDKNDVNGKQFSYRPEKILWTIYAQDRRKCKTINNFSYITVQKR